MFFVSFGIYLESVLTNENSDMDLKARPTLDISLRFFREILPFYPVGGGRPSIRHCLTLQKSNYCIWITSVFKVSSTSLLWQVVHCWCKQGKPDLKYRSLPKDNCPGFDRYCCLLCTRRGGHPWGDCELPVLCKILRRPLGFSLPATRGSR